MKNLLRCFLAALLPLGAIAPELKSESETVYPVVILGSGVGSLTSALYLARAGVAPLVVEGQNPGGLITQSHTVQNWPGEMDIEGAQLTDKIRKQVEANGAQFLREKVIKVDFTQRPFKLTLSTFGPKPKIHEISAEACIIAMGTEPNFLGIPGEKDYWGKGVTNCAVCDGSFYRDQVVGVVGGGDAAVLEALYLANIAKEVHVFVRKDSMRAIETKRLELLKEKSNVKFHFDTAVQAVKGDGQKVTGVVLSSKKTLPLDGVFLAIGSKPNSEVFKGALQLDDKGYILLKKDMETNIQGVYAVGDIVDPIFKQAISAAGDGAKAALQAQQYISDRSNNLIVKQAVVKTEVYSEVIEVQTEDEFYQEINGGMPVLADFFATWCGPCKNLSPDIHAAAGALAGKVKVLKVDVDKFPGLVKKYNIRGMPTAILFDGHSKEERREVGPPDIRQLIQDLEG
jgi:thioredoxin reductase (NADPH)